MALEAFYREQLNEMAEVNDEPCPDCGEIHPLIMFLRSECHPKAGVDVEYDSETGLLEVTCHKCDEHICFIAVASRPLPRRFRR
jgi:hypothetical protein